MWLGGTHIAACSNVPWTVFWGGLAHCWVLRRHLLCGRVFLVAILGLAGLTHWYVSGVVVGVGFGVWLCVECCIVDASILLWSSV